MLKLSAAQVKGIQAMGDMGIKGKFGVWMALPPVKPNTFTVLERLGAVERRESDGMWRLTIAGVTEYQYTAGLICTAIAAECAAKMAADDAAARFAKVMTGLEEDAPITEESVSWQAVRVRDAVTFNDGTYETERARLLDMLAVLYPTIAPYRIFDAWWGTMLTITEVADFERSDVTDHGFSAHSRRPVECRTCGQHASRHASYVPNDGSSEAMWRQVAPETAQSVGTPWKASKGKYGRHSKAWRG